MSVIFKATTNEGYVIKVLAELLQNNLNTACFEIDDTGIKLRMMDSQQTILINLEMVSTNFNNYRYTPDEKMYLGINIGHLQKMLKLVKKRDSVQFFITENCPTDLGIIITPKENGQAIKSYIKIQSIQNIDIDIPDGYGNNYITINSGEFLKMSKGLNQISSKTHVVSKGSSICFSGDADGVMSRSTEFGDVNASDDDSDEYTYCEDFNTDQLIRIVKLSGLSPVMQIYPQKGAPLLFKSCVGRLGHISIYLKSKNLQEMESLVSDNNSGSDSD